MGLPERDCKTWAKMLHTLFMDTVSCRLRLLLLEPGFNLLGLRPQHSNASLEKTE